MTISLAGLIGALVGFGVAWLDWKMVSGVLRRRDIEQSMKVPAEKRAAAERRQRLLLKVVFVVFFIGIPLVGYLTGVAIGG